MNEKKNTLLLFFILTVGLILFPNNLSSQQTAGELYEKALYLEEAKGDLQKAIELYEKILKQFPENREVSAKAQLQIGLCYEKLGLKEAQKAFQKVIDNFPEQAEAVKVAREKLSVLLKVQAMVEKGDKEFKMTKIQTDTEKMAYAFISPDGKRLAYVGTHGDIWVRDISSGEDIRLTQTPMFDYWCFWSHDSETIAYLDVLNGLHLIPAKGGEPKTLIAADSEFRKAGNYAWPACWSPDLTMLICYIIPSKNILAIPIAGGEWKEMFKFSDPKQAEDVSFIAISPNCKLIAYSSKESGQEHIYTMPIEGGESFQITQYPASYSTSWSFDSKWLAFNSTRGGDKEIWVVEISPDGKPVSEPFRVHESTDPSFGGTLLNWTKDKKLGICASRDFSNIFMVELESKKETQLTNIQGRDERPRWSPDGKKIAFISDREGKRNIWTMPSADGEASLITGNITFQTFFWIGSLSWSPDGKNIAFNMLVEDERGIWIIPVEGGPAKEVKFDYDGHLEGTAWSPDGKKIAFAYSRGKGDKNPIQDSRIDLRDIYTIPLEGGEPTRITEADDKTLDFYSPSWSPDGKKMAFFAADWAKYQEGKEDEAIWIMDIQEGEKPKQITKDLKGPLHSLCWSPDGENIVFPRWKKDKLYLHMVSIEDGEIQDLNIEGYRPDFSPDGKKIAYTRYTGNRTEFWILENFLPEEKK